MLLILGLNKSPGEGGGGENIPRRCEGKANYQPTQVF